MVNRLATAGLVFLPAAIPLVQRDISDYSVFVGLNWRELVDEAA
ncbi:MAG TPA: hypothetical protein VF016_09880 [Nitrososphaera sp.]|jgi:hypothetical protein